MSLVNRYRVLIVLVAFLGGLALPGWLPANSAVPVMVEDGAGLQDRIAQALARRGTDYRPNTRLLDADGAPLHTNRLIFESSPYLLQHAHNPVEWRPWGAEAFDEAKRLDRPIFLSVGYATCHWCHVMEEESFDNEEVAKALNANFVAIKLDRETRPDLDHVYMLATQLLTGHGGWPNSVFLLPDGQPFLAGSYFPKPQFLQLLASVADAWKSRRSTLVAQSERLAGEVARISSPSTTGAEISEAVWRHAEIQLRRDHNAFDGGFSRSTQFPQENYLLFLLDRWRREGDPAIRDVAVHTLRAIACGGLHDHVGGGFHRYTVDVNWRTPHFEKMLYNQALLSRAFVAAFAATGDIAFRRSAQHAFEYVERDMTVPDGPAAGAFFAAEDADSVAPSGEREEGYFYVWTPGQLREAIGGEEAEWVITALGIDAPPTLEHGAVAHFDPESAVDFERLTPTLARLREARECRPRPRRDDKVLTDWNGMMIWALAEGGLLLDESRHVETARKAGEAVWAVLHRKDNGLGKFYADGHAEGEGLLSDYAALGSACLALHDATRAPLWVERATGLAREMTTRFDDGRGGFREAAGDGPLGPVYIADDGAVPSGESMALEFLARLSVRTGSAEHRARAETLRGAIAGTVSRNPLRKTGGLVGLKILGEGESENSRAIANGHGRAVARLEGQTLRIGITLDPGWHVNSDKPNHPDLIPTSLAIADRPSDVEVEFPPAIERELGFAVGPLALFEGEFEIVATLREPPDGSLLVTLTIQACSDRICLIPETHDFRLR